MSFYIYSLSTGTAVVFCFDTPPIFETNLIDVMNTTGSDLPTEALAFLQSSIVGEIVRLYDTSVWTLRDHIRQIEKERTITGFLDRDLTPLHDLARHIIHTCEILAAAVDTIAELVGDYRSNSGISCTCPTGDAADAGVTKKKCPHNELAFWLRLLRNFGLRAESLKARLLNEINLGFNVIVQRDGSSMKAVAVVTLAVLPATFVSTLFSMSFFSQAEDNNTGKLVWVVSDQFWIYWAFAVPLTIVTLACWTYMQHRAESLKMLKSWKDRLVKMMSQR
ncbi:hypothetical protein A1O3_09906 [Capronia epimyces CBS 606.96]|uniref:Uncharacterized protein n=1 Tax=Capronia epimyces CBS 606.96 TaxID=1182542 RepID=W9XB01_9EURO|nr:uncharacterized protein A1O3_09906 [Capronia epimyces CBS 606.96]EXJ77677.1 hypothetical protein A1O3_09906 [Capronia epimyces CBS 606.96]